MAISLRASKQGLKIVDQARRKKGWAATSVTWCEAAQTTESTLKRFRRGEPIDRDVFVAICDAVGIKNWEEIVDDTPRSQKPTNNFREAKVNDLEKKTQHRGLYIPNARCQTVWGRERLIERVLSQLTDSLELPILSLNGVAGYGKTEAASQIAKAALAKNVFTDVLWVQARESELVENRITNESETLDWDQFLYEISRQLDCPPEREQVIRCLRKEKLLVVLDNAETADIEDILSKLVRMLNPSRALLTSRLKSSPSFVKPIECPGLEEEWSRKLLFEAAECKNILALLQADDEQLHRVHELSCGAPLALHFVIGRVCDDQALEPVLSALEKADGEVEVFYRFTLETAWQRISDAAKKVLHYMGRVDAGVPLEELCGTLELSDSDGRAARTQLERWSLILHAQDVKGNQRYDLHPWVRRSIRSGLLEKWQPSLEELEQITRWKFGI
ncbi:NB-ARC domain-containing protein [Calothrix sp. NIES-2098]|uniref:NB-ARC domain-containing protein n=1 Tax=Calothrix sp. NIES-2098 TaxID=1954171 RepID=UPI000B61664E|nr:hypothetical protein NIES2098_73610 [Calothrix sp. NIES-2098]